MVDSFEAIFTLLVEVDLRSHEELLAKDHFVLVGQLVCRLVSKIVVADAFMTAFQEVAVLVFDFSHYFLNSEAITICPHSFILSVSTFPFEK